MTNDKNIIRKETLNFQYNGNTDGIVLQQEVTDWCRVVLNPAIENLLSDYEESEEIIQVDAIHLDADIDATTGWQDVLKEKIMHQLKEKIQIKTGGNENNIIIKSLPGRFSETLIYFLKHGVLPWYSIIKTKNDFKTELSKWLTKESPEIKDVLLNFQDEKAVMRFVNLLSQEDFEIFVAGIVKKNRETISSIFTDVKTITGFISREKSLQLMLLKGFKQIMLSALAIVQPGDVINQAFEQWLLSIEKNYASQVKKINSGKVKNIEIKNVFRKIQKDIVAKSKKKRGQTADKPEEITAGNLLNKDADENDTELGKELADGIFISNAGAVIIAPFLTSLFSRAGLLYENSITDTETAVCLLHYCITGNTNPAEFELLFLKILCGINPETVVVISQDINKKILDEADEMLVSVIEYWSLLKDTSPNVLRDAFLQRGGKLSFAKDEWLLQVEQKSYDMLLQQLPWNITMIRLPWMQHLLRTEWV